MELDDKGKEEEEELSYAQIINLITDSYKNPDLREVVDFSGAEELIQFFQWLDDGLNDGYEQFKQINLEIYFAVIRRIKADPDHGFNAHINEWLLAIDPDSGFIPKFHAMHERSRVATQSNQNLFDLNILRPSLDAIQAALKAVLMDRDQEDLMNNPARVQFSQCLAKQPEDISLAQDVHPMLRLMCCFDVMRAFVVYPELGQNFTFCQKVLNLFNEKEMAHLGQLIHIHVTFGVTDWMPKMKAYIDKTYFTPNMHSRDVYKPSSPFVNWVLSSIEAYVKKHHDNQHVKAFQRERQQGLNVRSTNPVAQCFIYLSVMDDDEKDLESVPPNLNLPKSIPEFFARLEKLFEAQEDAFGGHDVFYLCFTQLLNDRPDPFTVSNSMYGEVGQWSPRSGRKSPSRNVEVDLSQYKLEYEIKEDAVVITFDTKDVNNSLYIMKQASVKVEQSARLYEIDIKAIERNVLEDMTTVQLVVKPADPKQLGFLEMAVAQNFSSSLGASFNS